MIKFFDVHTHTNLPGLKEESEAVIHRALAFGVGMVSVGTDIADSRLAVQIAHAFEKDPVYATVGFHPEYAVSKEFDYEAYQKLALDPKTVAIGECGLDYAVFVREQRERAQKRASAEAFSEGGLTDEEIGTMKKKQIAAFEEQIKLAHEVQKPLMIHCRGSMDSPQGDAFSDLINVLITNYQLLVTSRPGLIHFFTGTKDDAKKLLDLGFSFTFGGAITYPPKAGMLDYKVLVEYIPLDRILSETDAPFVAPVPYRGKRNEPAYVIEVVKKLAEIKNIGVDEMAARIVKNAQQAFAVS